jgi:hypothetical protein
MSPVVGMWLFDATTTTMAVEQSTTPPIYVVGGTNGVNAFSAILPNVSGKMILVPLLWFVIVPMEEATTTWKGVRIRMI